LLDSTSCVSSVVLTGGQSRRMGTDKALLVLDGKTLLRRSLDALRAVTSEIMIVGDRPAYHGHGVAVIADRYPGAGVLGGIATGLESTECAHVLVVACDMPYLSPDVLRAMIDVSGDYDAVVPMTEITGPDSESLVRYHPTHALYSRTCLPAILMAIAEHRLRITDVLGQLRVKALSERWMRSIDPTLSTLVNVNSPAEFEEAVRTYSV
jgi:molybdenum cofactor guanylyltransferase